MATQNDAGLTMKEAGKMSRKSTFVCILQAASMSLPCPLPFPYLPTEGQTDRSKPALCFQLVPNHNPNRTCYHEPLLVACPRTRTGPSIYISFLLLRLKIYWCTGYLTTCYHLPAFAPPPATSFRLSPLRSPCPPAESPPPPLLSDNFCLSDEFVLRCHDPKTIRPLWGNPNLTCYSITS